MRKMPGLLLGVMEGGSLERRVLRLIDARLPWARRWRVASAGACVAVMAAASLGVGLLAVRSSLAQSGADDWEKAAGGKMSFDVMSVKENRGGRTPENPVFQNFPWGSTPLYAKNGGRLVARNANVIDAIGLAYRLTGQDAYNLIAPQLPDWTRATRYDIQAQAPDGAEPTKDQMRLMMQSLLAQRFGLKVHRETRTVSAYALRLAEGGRLGPKLKLHTDASCPTVRTDQPGGTNTAPGQGARVVLADDGLPIACGFMRGIPDDPRKAKWAARGTSLGEIQKMLTVWIDDGRPVVNQTGLDGLYDFSLEAPRDPEPDYGQGTVMLQGAYGPELRDALLKQLGLKVDLTKAPVEMLIVDHIEKPTEN